MTNAIKVLSGSEMFSSENKYIDRSVKDFWAWALSRLLADGTRGSLAEFIVSIALGIDITYPQRGWGEYDVRYYRGDSLVRIEVKCSSVIQA